MKQKTSNIITLSLFLTLAFSEVHHARYGTPLFETKIARNSLCTIDSDLKHLTPTFFLEKLRKLRKKRTLYFSTVNNCVDYYRTNGEK